MSSGQENQRIGTEQERGACGFGFRVSGLDITWVLGFRVLVSYVFFGLWGFGFRFIMFQGNFSLESSRSGLS